MPDDITLFRLTRRMKHSFIYRPEPALPVYRVLIIFQHKISPAPSNKYHIFCLHSPHYFIPCPWTFLPAKA